MREEKIAQALVAAYERGEPALEAVAGFGYLDINSWFADENGEPVCFFDYLVNAPPPSPRALRPWSLRWGLPG